MKNIYVILWSIIALCSWESAFPQEWVRQNPFEDLRSLADVDFAEDGLGIAVGNAGLMMRTEDFGETWETLSNDLTSNFYVVKIGPGANTNRVLWVGGNKLFKSNDDGLSWEEFGIPPGVNLPRYMSVIDEGTLFLANNSKVAKTVDGGMNWDDITPPGVNNPSSIYFTDSQHGWVGNREGKIFYTNDGGTTWTEILLAEGNNAVMLTFLNAQDGYAGVW